MGYLEFLVHFYLQNHTGLVKFSYLNFAPLNLYPKSEDTVTSTCLERMKWLEYTTIYARLPVIATVSVTVGR